LIFLIETPPKMSLWKFLQLIYL